MKRRFPTIVQRPRWRAVRFNPILGVASMVVASSLSSATRAETHLPGILSDINKYSTAYDSDHRQYLWYVTVAMPVPIPWIYCNVLPADLDNDFEEDPGEDWTQTINGLDGKWAVAQDGSCWAATAANMVQYISGLNFYHEWMYQDGVETPISDNDTTFWYEGGDLPMYALDDKNYDNHNIYATDPLHAAWSHLNPIDWIEIRLRHGKPIGISFKYDNSFKGHVVTAYGIDTANQRILVADSDSGLPPDSVEWRDYSVEVIPTFGMRFLMDTAGGDRQPINSCTSFETRIWTGSGVGDDQADDWSLPLLAWSGSPAYDVYEIIMDRPATCWVRTTGEYTTRLVLYGDPSNLAITNTGALSLRTFMMRENPGLGISGFFLTRYQSTIEGEVNLTPGGEWWTEYNGWNFIGAGGAGTVNQTGGYLDNWNLVLGHEAGVGIGHYNLNGGQVRTARMVIGDAGSGYLDMSGGQVATTAISTDSGWDPSTAEVILAEKPGSYGEVSLRGGTINIPRLTVGGSGTAVFSHFNTGAVNAGTVALGTLGGSATWTMTDDSSLTAVDLTIGASATPVNGARLFLYEGDVDLSGTLAIGNNGLLHAQGGYVGAKDLILGKDAPGTLAHVDASVDVSRMLRIQQGSIYPMSGGDLYASQMVVGHSTAGTFQQDGGTAQPNALYIGFNQGNGTLTFNDGTLSPGQVHFGGSALTTGTGTQSGGYMDPGTEVVGNLGTGNLTITAGTHLVENLVIGDGSGGTGTVEVTGGIFAAGGIIIGDAGTGTLRLAGGTNTATGPIRLGVEAGSTGTFTLDWGTFSAPASTMYLGVNGNGILKFGTHTPPVSNTAALILDELVVSSGGSIQQGSANPNVKLTANRITPLDHVQVPMAVHLGVPGTSTSAASTVAAGTSLTAPSLRIGEGRSARVTAAFGSVIDVSGEIELGSGAGHSGSLDSEAILTADTMRVGSLGSGTLNLTRGTATVATARIGIGAPGYVVLDGTGRLNTTDETLGDGRAGQFEQLGGVHTVNLLKLAEKPGSSAAYYMSGGILVADTIQMGLGGGAQIQHGSGTIQVSGRLSVGHGTGTGQYVFSGGTLKVGTLQIGSLTAPTGNFIWNGGTLNADSVELLGNGYLAIGHLMPAGVFTMPVGLTMESTAAIWADTGHTLVLQGDGTSSLTGDITATRLLISPTTASLINQSAGTITSSDIGLGQADASAATSYNFNGGFIQSDAIVVHPGSTFAQSGTAALDCGSVTVGRAAFPAAHLSLAGGTLAADAITLAGTGTDLNWSAGTLQAGSVLIGSGTSMTTPAAWNHAGHLYLVNGTFDNPLCALSVAPVPGKPATMEINGGSFRVAGMDLGGSGDLTLDMTAGTLEVGGDFTLSTAPGGQGASSKLKGGTILVGGRLVVGRSGEGELYHRGSLVTTAGAVGLGENAGSSGRLALEGGELHLAESKGTQFIIGNEGAGELIMGTASASGRIYEDGASAAADLVIRRWADGSGLLSGWGIISLRGMLANNGRVVADGYGAPRTLDLSTLGTRLENSIENTGTNGWYAVRKGRLVLPLVPAVDGQTRYNWGEGEDDAIDLVNSVQLHFESLECRETDYFDLMLLASDHPDVPPMAGIVGVWGVKLTEDIQFRGARLTFCYDDALLKTTGHEPRELQLYALENGIWRLVESTLDEGSRCVTSGSIETVAQMYALRVGPTPIEEWAASYGLSLKDSLPDANPSGDGIVNLLKYAFKMDPSVAASGPERYFQPGLVDSGLPLIETAGNRLRVYYVRRRGAADISYQVQFGSGLGPADWIPFTGFEKVRVIDDIWEEVSVEDPISLAPPATTARFGRVKVFGH